MQDTFNIGDRVVIRFSMLSYLVGSYGTVVGRDGNDYKIEFDEPIPRLGEETGSAQSRWFSSNRLSLLGSLVEPELSIKFSFDELLGG